MGFHDTNSSMKSGRKSAHQTWNSGDKYQRTAGLFGSGLKATEGFLHVSSQFSSVFHGFASELSWIIFQICMKMSETGK